MDDHTHIEIYQDENSQWYWRFQDGDGNILATSSESYQERMDCENTLAVVFGSVMLVGDRVVSVNRKHDTIPVGRL